MKDWFAQRADARPDATINPDPIYTNSIEKAKAIEMQEKLKRRADRRARRAAREEKRAAKEAKRAAKAAKAWPFLLYDLVSITIYFISLYTKFFENHILRHLLLLYLLKPSWYKVL